MKLGDRKLRILKVIIDDYINTAQPVGSRTISKKPTITVSSATIRNEMADLEELGYLMQPHTSAGRIPSDMGYRLYVDLMEGNFELGREQKGLIQSMLASNIIEIEDVILHALSLLSKMTGLTTVISLPLFKKSKLKNMKLIKVNESKVLLIMVSDTGVVKSISLGIKDIEQEVLDVIADCLLIRFADTAIESINVKQIYAIKPELGSYSGVIDYLMPILRDSLREIEDFEVYVDGVNNVFILPEFNDMSRAKGFLELMNDKHLIYRALEGASEKMIVSIGHENEIKELQQLTVIAAPYKFNGKNDGRIGIIGPTRMNYDYVMSTIQYIADTLSNIFSGINL
jgi:heat-inducible transcriptional repressor